MALNIPLSCATSSLNPFPAATDPPHDLVSKLHAIAHADFRGIELAFPDLLAYTRQRLGREVASDSWDELCTVGRELKAICHDLGLEIIMLQPFSNFEGWPRGSLERDDAFRRAAGWIEIMQAIGTDMLQVGSTDATSITLSKTELAKDLTELCAMLSVHGMRLAYENWCWATAAPTWRDVLELVQLTDCPNIGLCLDTFQTAGYEWGDPTESSGQVENEQYFPNLKELEKIPAEKIYLLQISDAYRPPEPLSRDVENEMRPRARWSQSFRPMSGQGYLPVVDMGSAVLRSGFRGWFSVEIFDGGPDGKGRPKQDLCKEADELMRLARDFVGRSERA